MRNNNILILMVIILGSSLMGCYQEEDSMYDVLGGVATITVWTPSKTNPAADEAMTVRARYYSEKATVTELRFYAKVGAADRTLVETVPITTFRNDDSYERVFNYTVPGGTPASTVIIFTVEVETTGDLINSRSTPATGTSAVRTI